MVFKKNCMECGQFWSMGSLWLEWCDNHDENKTCFVLAQVQRSTLSSWNVGRGQLHCTVRLGLMDKSGGSGWAFWPSNRLLKATRPLHPWTGNCHMDKDCCTRSWLSFALTSQFDLLRRASSCCSGASAALNSFFLKRGPRSAAPPPFEFQLSRLLHFHQKTPQAVCSSRWNIKFRIQERVSCATVWQKRLSPGEDLRLEERSCNALMAMRIQLKLTGCLEWRWFRHNSYNGVPGTQLSAKFVRSWRKNKNSELWWK